jgi:hypothetical protein
MCCEITGHETASTGLGPEEIWIGCRICGRQFVGHEGWQPTCLTCFNALRNGEPIHLHVPRSERRGPRFEDTRR